MNGEEFQRLLQSYPELRGKLRGGNTEFVPFNEKTAETLAASVYIIPFLPDGLCLMTRRANGAWVLPGGTMEPEETWEAAAHRELVEETGCRPLSLNPIGMYKCTSKESEPRLPHIPHPIHFRIVAWSYVDQVNPPDDPDPTSRIAEVRPVEVESACDLFDSNEADSSDFGALYRAADFLRQATQTEIGIRDRNPDG